MKNLSIDLVIDVDEWSYQEGAERTWKLEVTLLHGGDKEYRIWIYDHKCRIGKFVTTSSDLPSEAELFEMKKKEMNKEYQFTNNLLPFDFTKEDIINHSKEKEAIINY